MNREAIADRIIQDHVLYASFGGALPVPALDVAAVTAIQIDLVRALARVYEVPFDPAVGKAIVTSLTGASLARLGASAVKALPLVGSIPGIITQAGLSSASTYAVGQLFRGHFAEQGTLADLEPREALPKYRELVERGKDVVKSFRPVSRRSVEDTATTLERLQRLRDSAVIDEREFSQLKSDLLAEA